MAGVRGPAASNLTVRAYIDLVDCTGRITRPDKGGAISDAAARALDAIRGSPDWWVGCVGRIEEVFATAVGSPQAIKERAAALDLRSLRGAGAAW